FRATVLREPALEELLGDAGDDPAVLRGGCHGALAGEGGEIVLANFHRDASRGEMPRPEAGAGALREPIELGREHPRVRDIPLESVLGAHGALVPVRLDRAIIDAARALPEPRGIAAKDRYEPGIRRPAQLPDRCNAERLDPLSGLATEPRQTAHRE